MGGKAKSNQTGAERGFGGGATCRGRKQQICPDAHLRLRRSPACRVSHLHAMSPVSTDRNESDVFQCNARRIHRQHISTALARRRRLKNEGQQRGK
jgi:hypothetical protein